MKIGSLFIKNSVPLSSLLEIEKKEKSQKPPPAKSHSPRGLRPRDVQWLLAPSADSPKPAQPTRPAPSACCRGTTTSDILFQFQHGPSTRSQSEAISCLPPPQNHKGWSWRSGRAATERPSGERFPSLHLGFLVCPRRKGKAAPQDETRLSFALKRTNVSFTTSPGARAI